MSFAWHEIREHLTLSSSTLGFQRKFEALRRSRKPLRRFVDPTAMLDTLRRNSATSDQKNQILVTLVKAAQGGDPTADCALTLMLLALWPGLDGVLRRSKWRRIGTLDELPSEIFARATEAVRCLDLGRVTSIAATILMNIERDLVRAHQRQVSIRRLFIDMDLDQVMDRRHTPAHSTSRQFLREELAREIGVDADIVIRVAVDGHSQVEAAAALGLTEAAARKRYQRATSRLRQVIQNLC
ncbi:RNA polymerase sigma factor [Mesorhizobium sp. IMUNJ 23232]|uniref:RNA polymerase sigma factor n=1 Tax=Mesorhizobium sp. IMUNJ 23232 TaxID=3376064 RepID=UPI0037874FED